MQHTTTADVDMANVIDGGDATPVDEAVWPTVAQMWHRLLVNDVDLRFAMLERLMAGAALGGDCLTLDHVDRIGHLEAKAQNCIDVLEDVLNQATFQEDTTWVTDADAPGGRRLVRSNPRLSHDFLSAYENAFDFLVGLGRARYLDNGIDIELLAQDDTPPETDL